MFIVNIYSLSVPLKITRKRARGGKLKLFFPLSHSQIPTFFSPTLARCCAKRFYNSFSSTRPFCVYESAPMHAFSKRGFFFLSVKRCHFFWRLSKREYKVSRGKSYVTRFRFINNFDAEWKRIGCEWTCIFNACEWHMCVSILLLGQSNRRLQLHWYKVRKRERARYWHKALKKDPG